MRMKITLVACVCSASPSQSVSLLYGQRKNMITSISLCVCQVWCGLSDGGVERRHGGPGLQRYPPPLHLPVGPAAVQLRRRPPVDATHLPLPRLHEGPGGALQKLPIASTHADRRRGSRWRRVEGSRQKFRGGSGTAGWGLNEVGAVCECV